MAELRSKKVWRNGEFVDWESATVHVMSHALHYGSSWFEGIRCYKTRRGSEVFRLREHVKRLFDSCKIYRVELPFSEAEFCEAVLQTIDINEMEQCYIRPLVFRGFGSMGVNPLPAPVEACIIVWQWGRYLGEEALEKGVDLCVSSWQRAAPNTFPTMAKAGGNYLNSGLIKMEATTRGFAEGIALDTQGFVSEGSGENLFVVRNGKLITPPLSCSILPGITRDSVITLAHDAGYEVLEQADSARNALPGRRGFSDRNRRRGDPDTFRGRDCRWEGPSRARHERDSDRLLRLRGGKGRRPIRLDDGRQASRRQSLKRRLNWSCVHYGRFKGVAAGRG